MGEVENLKISIITINYNNLEGLKKTVESVINQTYKNIEYIIVDGGSTDGSAAYIQDMSAHFNYWVSEPDKGIYNAMNKGIDKATGEYLLFLNSGDFLFDTEIIERVVETNPKSDIVFGHLKITKLKEPGKDYVYKRPLNVDLIDLYEKGIPHPSTFFKKILFENYGKYKEEYKIVSDWEYYLRLKTLYNIEFSNLNFAISVFNFEGLSNSEEGKEIDKRERQLVKDSLFSKAVQSAFDDSIVIREKYHQLLKSNTVRISLKWVRKFGNLKRRLF